MGGGPLVQVPHIRCDAVNWLEAVDVISFEGLSMVEITNNQEHVGAMSKDQDFPSTCGASKKYDYRTALQFEEESCSYGSIAPISNDESKQLNHTNFQTYFNDRWYPT